MSTSATPRPAPGRAQSLARESLKVQRQSFWAQPLPVPTTQRAGARPVHGRIPLSSVSSERRSSSTTALLQAAAPQTGQMNSRCTKFNSAPARLLSPEAASLQSDFLRGLRRIISTLSPTRSTFSHRSPSRLPPVTMTLTADPPSANPIAFVRNHCCIVRSCWPRARVG